MNLMELLERAPETQEIRIDVIDLIKFIPNEQIFDTCKGHKSSEKTRKYFESEVKIVMAYQDYLIIGV